MPAVPAAALARQLRSLDRAELAAFVADLWAARGFETAVEGSTVIAERAGRVERIQCGRGRVEDAAIVVDVSRGPATADDRDVRVVDPETLRELLCYAVDRGTADRLCRAHLDRPLAAQPADAPLRERLPEPPARPLFALVLVAIVTVGVVFGASGALGPLGGAEPTGSTVRVATVQLTASADPATATVGSTNSGLPAAGGSLFRYPPGIGSSGVTDADALASAHRSALANTSWTLAVTHRGAHDLLFPYRNWTGSEQVVVRGGPTRYRTEVVGFGRGANGSFRAETFVDYGDGTANYRRHIGLLGDAFSRTRLPPDRSPDVFTALSAAYVHRYLSTTESRVETIRSGATTRQRVVATGTPTAMARTVANYTAVAVVDRRGVVHTLVVEYTLLERVPDPTPNGVATPYQSADRVPTEPVGTVRFEMVLTGLGSTTLDPPGWYDRARNATNGTVLPPWPADPAV